MILGLAQIVPSFIVPGLAVAGVAAISIPIAIHILSKRPRKPEPWAAMRFLLAAYRKHRLRTRLEQWVLLAMRCLLVALLGIALAGPIWSAAGALTGLSGGRTVVLVVDDSVTSGAVDAPGHTRLRTLQDVADKLLASLGSGDRAALITVSRPAEPVVAPPTADPSAVRNQVRQLTPSPAAADFQGALRLAKQALEDASRAGGRAYLVLLSDLSAGAVGLEEGSASPGLPRDLAGLDAMATLLHNEPLPPASNVQIASLAPDRRAVVPPGRGQTPSVIWTVGLRRQTVGDAPAAALTVRLRLLNGPPVRRTVSFEPGQREVELPISTPIAEPGLITAEASLEPAAQGTDVLAADNIRHATVVVRQKVTVMLVGDDEAAKPQQGPFTPQRWLETALAPVSDRLGWPVEVQPVDAPSIGTDAVDLSKADAAIILRPDQLTDEGFVAIRRWVEGGGLAWFVPPAATGASQLWPQKLVATFGLPWSIEPEPVEHGEEERALPLKVDAPAAGELARLSADLTDLLRPVAVYRRLVIDPASLGSATEFLLQGSGGEPILIGATADPGRGRVMLLASAVDTGWTNLPAKPLMVPLIHEALRAAIDRPQPPLSFEPGDVPELGPAWFNTARITSPDGEPLLLVREGQGGPRPLRPLEQTGVYRAETSALVVNISSEAADTRAADPTAIRSLLGGAGAWRGLSLSDPGAALAVTTESADVSWPLLWVVLVLAVAETFFARLVSHARASDRGAGVLESLHSSATEPYA